MNQSYVIILTLICIGTIGVLHSSALETPVDYEAAQISIQNVTLDPEILMQGDTGNIVIQIRNIGNQSVAIRRAELSCDALTVLNDQTYNSVGTIGPGNSMKFAFSIKADHEDGTYYLKFYLDFMGSGSLRYYIPVTVESSELQVSVIDSPDIYTNDRKEQIYLTVGNPRKKSVDGVIVTPNGEDIRSTQSSVFIGSLEPNAQKNVTLEITPKAKTNLTVETSYKNGDNKHIVSLQIPVETGIRNIRAEPIVSDLEVIKSGDYYTLKGDIINNGLEFAHSIILSAGFPASSIDPSPDCVVGNLEPDESANFRMSLTCHEDTFPLTIRYKDIEGDLCSDTTMINLSHPEKNASREQKISGFGTIQILIGVGAGIILLLGAFFVLSRRTKLGQTITNLKRR
ncbi:MAG: hypothetical protein LUQ50_04995 [Methanospirillum sp.]|uniref:COG1361 S-layer family protein n=1 Tax=Methanospirillum sp. TaxID=45200 RepID=UPI00236918A6|nr:hypothetical protein [Methanospirillum sp.]MDD1728413.1 hypothetical protein [Methanospirillum sp.]